MTVVTPPRCSIVLPCFNEGFRIASSLATLDAWFGTDVEILVVDDGSLDDTSEQAERYASDHPHVRVHRLTTHRGKGSAIRAAIPLVRGERVVFVDADLAFDAASVRRALDALGTADMAVGNRRLPGSYYLVPVGVFWFLYRRHVLGLVFNALVRVLSGLRQRDTQCGLKAYRRAALEKIAPRLSVDRFAIDVEVLLVAAAFDMQVAEVPVQVRYDSAKSSVTMVASGWQTIADLVRIAIRRARGQYARLRPRARFGARKGSER